MARLVELSGHPAVLPQAVELVEEYVRLPDAWHGTPPIDLPVWFREELAQFPGEAMPPRGEVVVGFSSTAAVAVGLLVPFTEQVVEMKRLYVRIESRRTGIGRLLVGRLVDNARAFGYEKLVLDVMTERHDAVRLYTSLGFVPAEPYRTYEALSVELTSLAMEL